MTYKELPQSVTKAPGDAEGGQLLGAVTQRRQLLRSAGGEGLGVEEGCGTSVDLDDPCTYDGKVVTELYNIPGLFVTEDTLLCPKTYTFENQEKLLEKAAELIAEEKVIGWFQGPMEFGPRALGNRSIIGDARSEKMQQIMNLKIKFRESFRPFAPCVLREYVDEYFETRPEEDSHICCWSPM